MKTADFSEKKKGNFDSEKKIFCSDDTWYARGHDYL